MKSERFALIPAYEPEDNMLAVVREMTGLGFQAVVVDDGSGPAFEEVFAQASACGTLLRHEVNRGKGAAVRTGLSWIRTQAEGPCTVVTLDADGQHLPEDARRAAEAAEAEPGALILGRRTFQGHAPLRNRFGNAVTRAVFHLSTGTRVFDTQTGLRAFSGDWIPFMLEIQGDRYEYEMNVLMSWARSGRPIREIPIETVYIDGNTHSHFSVLKDSFRIYREILKFSAASLTGFFVDYGLFCLLSAVTDSVTLPNILARVVSGSVNYTLNRKLVFHSRAGVGQSLIGYAALACGILALNTALLWLLSAKLGLSRYAAKILVEIGLFALSYFVQKRWIFRKKETGGTPSVPESGKKKGQEVLS